MAERQHWAQLELFPTVAIKRCRKCGEVKPLSDFHRKRTAPDGHQGLCRSCNIAAAKQFHADNLDHCRQRISAWMRRVDRENKRCVLAFLHEHPCVDCGEADPVVLEFDHVQEKATGIAELLHRHVRWEVVAAEIANCEVRCANCHRRKTATTAGWFRAVEGWAARDSNPEPAG